MKPANFFEKKNFKIKQLFPNNHFKKNRIVKDVRPLNYAGSDEITFFDSVKYKDLANKTKASYCITNENLTKFLPSNTEKIIVKTFY